MLLGAVWFALFGRICIESSFAMNVISQNDEDSQSDGALGAFCADEYPLIGRTTPRRMQRRAFRQRWAIPDDMKPEIVQRQYKIAVGENAREATAAARVLIAMERLNQIDETSVGNLPLPVNQPAGLATVARPIFPVIGEKSPSDKGYAHRTDPHPL